MRLHSEAKEQEGNLVSHSSKYYPSSFPDYSDSCGSGLGNETPYSGLRSANEVFYYPPTTALDQPSTIAQYCMAFNLCEQIPGIKHLNEVHS